MNYNPYALTGKTILITGASSGIGRATAIECAKLNATCVLCGRNELRLQETLRLLEGTGHIAISADLLKEEGIHAIVEQTLNLDGVVCNAGVNMMSPIYFLKSEEVDKVLRTNTIAPMTLVNALLRNKRIKNQSSLVFTSSLDAVNPDVGSSVYAASKAA